MKQLGLWESLTPEPEAIPVTWQLFIDGASKNNPGPSGSGFVIMKNNEIICRQGFYLGKKTNNQAEYYALILGIFFLKKYMQKSELVTITSDSKLLVMQMIGVYKVKDVHLGQLKNLAALWLQGYRYKMKHVLREYNTLADEMANYGVQHKVSVPQEFLHSLQEHDIIF